MCVYISKVNIMSSSSIKFMNFFLKQLRNSLYIKIRTVHRSIKEMSEKSIYLMSQIDISIFIILSNNIVI